MGLRNAPKILRGAFIEYGLSLPPLFVTFQFNPVELSRSRSLSFEPPSRAASEEEAGDQNQTLREYHLSQADLLVIQDEQRVKVEPETISFDIRLDATDALSDGDVLVGQFGIAPRLATLELMMQPKGESLLGGLVDSLLNLNEGGFSFTKKPNPPLVLFVWGRHKVVPVNITSMSVTETEFNTQLFPTRATVSVSMNVIEGKNWAYTYTKATTEAASLLNLANIAEIANVVIPG